jgi:oligoendopeptidase F
MVALPENALEFMNWSWNQIDPTYQELANRPLSEENLVEWMTDWSRVGKLVRETHQRLFVAISVDTNDARSEKQFIHFLDEIFPAAQAAEQKLKEKLLASGLEPEGFGIPLRNMRAEADLFCEANLPLLSEELKMSAEYDKIIGAQTVEWEGQELTVAQMQPIFMETDRERRERAWRLAARRQLEDRETINSLWGKFLQLRGQLAANANKPDYRTYRWQQLLRFDYTPDDCHSFHRAIEQVVVPAASRIYEKRRQRLGVKTLRPWDMDVDTLGRDPLKPFQNVAELEAKTAAIFHRVDEILGEYFEIMRREALLDLDNRKGKAPGGYCTDFPASNRPFIFANSVGVHDDVQTLLHEGGHAFHAFESFALPYIQQQQVPMEFAEVASMGMELLASPYLQAKDGGFYTAREAARARIENLERSLLFWPYMAVVDAFQHWVYENPQSAAIPANCDAAWGDLWQRFMPDMDWSGLEEELKTGWQRKLHIHTDPFYYVEYGLAQLGAMQVWRNALDDQAAAVAAYRRALSLGATVSLPQLFTTAGARFALDAATLGEAVELMMRMIEKLETE